MRFMLSTRILLATLAGTVVVSASLAVGSILITSSTVDDLSRRVIDTTAHRLGDQVGIALNAMTADAKALFRSADLQGVVQELRAGWKMLKTDQGAKLRKAFIDDNENPPAERFKLASAAGFKEYYNEVHPTAQRLLSEVMTTGRFRDIAFVDMTGNVYYSYAKTDLLGRQIKLDAAATSEIERIVAASMPVNDQTLPGPIAFSGLTLDGEGQPTGYFSVPVIKDGRFLAVALFIIHPQMLHGLLADTSGLGASGRTMLVIDGARGVAVAKTGFEPLSIGDETFARIIGEDHLMDRMALFGGTGQVAGFHAGEAGKTTFAVGAAMDEAEMQEPVSALRLTLAGIAVVTALLVLLAMAAVVRRIMAPLGALTRQVGALAEGQYGVDVIGVERADEIGQLARSVAVFRDSARERERLEAAQVERLTQDAARQGRVGEMIERFRSEIASLTGVVDQRMEDLSRTAGTLGDLAGATLARSDAAAQATAQAAANVASVQETTAELSSSISEISAQINRTSTVVADATASAQDANAKVGGLAEAASAIGQIVQLIQEIAEQTNLLALNATIESARAGAAGRGFSVVASEVKNLANQTGRATEQIAREIGRIQGSTREAVEAIGAITRTMDHVNQYTQAIAAAITEQTHATGQIGANVGLASEGTAQVGSNVEDVTHAARQTAGSAEAVSRATADVAAQTEILKRSVAAFLADVAAA